MAKTAPLVLGLAARWFEVVLTCGRVVRVPESFDASELGRLLAVVERGTAC